MAKLSSMAARMLWNYGEVRLPTMLAEHEAGLPPDMPVVLRMERMAAIKEVLAHLTSSVKTKKKK